MRIFSVIIFALITSFSFGQSELFTAIGKADVESLSTDFSNDIEVCIGTDQDFYSKNGAVKRIEKFFNKVKPTSSSFKHKGNSKDKSSKYSVGSMESEDGNYRVFIYFEGSKISGLMFNKE